MAGIYIHIPYCTAKCDYCNFFSQASMRGRDEIASAICRETNQRSTYLNGETVSTIYFGGGTPSLLPVQDIEQMLECIHSVFKLSSDAEISLEANPNDIVKEKLLHYRRLGINRLSIGIQSFFADDLHYLSRKHDPDQALAAIDIALACGFENTSIDLIFGIPTQDLGKLEKNLEIFYRFGLPHLSAYALTVEPNTALQWKIGKGRIRPVHDEAQSAHFLFLMEWMEKQGYVQYEISNYSKPGYESKHNSAYWSGARYIGLGPSAHSFDGSSRQWNVSNIAKYLEGIKSGKLCYEKETLSRVQQHNEYIMMAIRTSRGIDAELLRQRYGEKAKDSLTSNLAAIARANGNEWFVENDGCIRLTKQGVLFADRIASELFINDLS